MLRFVVYKTAFVSKVGGLEEELIWRNFQRGKFIQIIQTAKKLGQKLGGSSNLTSAVFLLANRQSLSQQKLFSVLSVVTVKTLPICLS